MVFITGCSVIGKSGKSNTSNYNNDLNINVLEGTKFQNLTNIDFFIQKAEIEIITQNGKEKYLASVKFEKPDKFLISVKSRTGIEGARIYISNDSILVNDRINKKLYSGKAFYLKKKFGISPDLLPLIFGDMILDKDYKDINERCIENKILIESHLKGIILNYEIDCSKRKVISVSQIDSFDKNVSKLRFGNFFHIGSNQIPRIIEFDDSRFDTVIKIKVFKIEAPWDGTIKFIPGKGYELIDLV